MEIVSSITAENYVLPDGRRSVVEYHTDSAGIAHRRSYIAPAEFQQAEELTSNADKLSTSLNEAETMAAVEAQAESDTQVALAKVEAALEGSGVLTAEETALLLSKF